MEIYIDNRKNDFVVSIELKKLLYDVIKESLNVEGLDDNYEISISFVENKEIKELNKNYRGIDKETDVLSFPMEDEFDSITPMLGDMIISIDKAIEQAIEYGHSTDREIAYLTAHSMFHLLGYDHMETEDKTEMRNMEKQVMKNLKLFKDDKKE